MVVMTEALEASRQLQKRAREPATDSRDAAAEICGWCTDDADLAEVRMAPPPTGAMEIDEVGSWMADFSLFPVNLPPIEQNLVGVGMLSMHEALHGAQPAPVNNGLDCIMQLGDQPPGGGSGVASAMRSGASGSGGGAGERAGGHAAEPMVVDEESTDDDEANEEAAATARAALEGLRVQADARQSCPLYMRAGAARLCRFDGKCFRRDAAHAFEWAHQKEPAKPYCPTREPNRWGAVLCGAVACM